MTLRKLNDRRQRHQEQVQAHQMSKQFGFSWKASGLDGISSEMIKAGGETVAKFMVLMFNDILRNNTIPNSFQEAKIIVIFLIHFLNSPKLLYRAVVYQLIYKC